MRSKIPLLFGTCFVAALLAIGAVRAAPTMVGLSAADVASRAARGAPAIVVFWAPDCLACRKSLGEIERFGISAAERGISVRTIVPGDVHEEAQAMVSSRGLALSVEPDAGSLDVATRRILLDRPLAYAVTREGDVAGARAGLLGAWALEELAAEALGAGR